MPGTVCVLGSLNIDLVVRAPHLPLPGETLLGGSFATLPGGKGANQAVAAARAGASVRMIGRVGADPHGDLLRRVLLGEGVDCSNVRPVNDAPTGVALITIDERSGENTIIVAGGANAGVTRTDVDVANAAIADAAVLLMQLETPLSAVTHGAEVARRLGATVVLNAAPAPAPGLPRELLALIDVLIVNETEAAMLCGLDPAADTAPLDLLRAAATLGPRAVVLTVGARGAIARTEGRTLRSASFAVQPVDTVGCGDAFCGTLAAAISAEPAASRVSSRSLAGAMLRASAAGALAATKHGAIPSLPRLDEVRALISSQPDVRVEEST